MSYRKYRWKGRAPDASADAVFERALLGEDRSAGKAFDPHNDRKTQQLCQQVRRALMLALAGECNDEVLRNVYVESVDPMGSASQLLVRVAIPRIAQLPCWEVLARLNDRSARLRILIAQSICRKRAPNLTFVVIPENPEALEEGAP